MPPTRIYYTVKPLIPRRVQIAFRRQRVACMRRKYAHIWPIDPDAATPPEGWQGWPDGKQFALVLSHDVDTLGGYENVLKLAALEEEMGFRSQFNFVPERYGRVSLELLDELRRRGFGIGVHGLKHDGKLFASKHEFDRRAIRINEYLSAWKTQGFTSPSMYHNLEWMTALNITHSTSTFDTDPFEPQSDGAGTIFPFAVHRNSDRPSCYMELPYTLPQDHLLFAVLQERDTSIWRHKLDWVAEKGGMALLNTHPDYMSFDGARPSLEQYPVGLYQEFLEHIRTSYRDRYWHGLPGDVAGFIARTSRGGGKAPACQVNAS